MGKSKVEIVRRELIQEKLLLALEDEGAVAALLTAPDLEILTMALSCAIAADQFVDLKTRQRAKGFLLDLKRLAEVFG